MSSFAKDKLITLAMLALAIMILHHGSPAKAQNASAYLVEDLATGQDPTTAVEPIYTTVANDRIFFSGRHPLTGRELWTSDGTPEGTRLFGDLCSGPCNIGSLRDLIVFDDAVFFQNCDALEVCQLWRSDGTPQGTGPFFLHNRHRGRMESLTAWNGSLYFLARSIDFDFELYRSDGTTHGTERIVLAPGPDNTKIQHLAASDNHLFIEARLDDGEREIWVLDGTLPDDTLSSATLVLTEGQVISRPWFNTGARLFLFTGYGRNLWTSDGTVDGTRQIVAGGGSLRHLAAVPGEYYFTRYTGIDVRNTELWVSDGTFVGTRQLRTFDPVSANYGTAVFGALYFAIDDQLWRTDATPQGTEQVATLDSRIIALAAGPLGDELLIGTEDGLWRMDADGERELLDGDVVARHFVAFRDGLVFSAEREATGREIGYVVNGLVTPLTDLADPGSIDLVGLSTRGDSLVFGNDDPDGPVVYETNGQTTERLATLEAGGGFGRSNFRTLTVDGQSFVLQNDLWVVREGELQRVFRETPDSRSRRWLMHDSATALGDLLYFLVWDQAEGGLFELWASDGTLNGTRRLDHLTEFSPEDPDLPRFGMLTDGDRLFAFVESQLWTTDGSEGGAVEIDLGTGCETCHIGPVAIVGDRLFFSTAGETFFLDPPWDPRRLWISDGTTSGTSMIREFEHPRQNFGLPAAMNEFFGIGETLFFTVETTDLGEELWSSDGTAAGTDLVIDLLPGPDTSKPRGLTVLDGQIYFSADDGIHGRELWTADTSPFNPPWASARMVADLRPGASSSSPMELAVIENRNGRGRLYFSADDGLVGREPWMYDGTERDPQLLYDIQPGRLPSQPSSFHAAGNRLYFSAGTEEHGFELWAAPLNHCDRCRLMKEAPP